MLERVSFNLCEGDSEWLSLRDGSWATPHIVNATGQRRGGHVEIEPADERKKKSSVACPLLCPLRRPPLLVSFLSLVLVGAEYSSYATLILMYSRPHRSFRSRS